MFFKRICSIVLLVGLWLTGTVAQAVVCLNDIPPNNPDDVYIVNNDGTITDSRTGLMWKQCLEGDAACSGTGVSMNWPAALAAATASEFAGYSDWRLPNHKELESLVEYCRSAPAVNAGLSEFLCVRLIEPSPSS